MIDANLIKLRLRKRKALFDRYEDTSNKSHEQEILTLLLDKSVFYNGKLCSEHLASMLTKLT